MATYSYWCDQCQQEFQIVRPMSANEASVTCPECHGERTRRVYQAPYQAGRASQSGCATCAPSSASACAGCGARH